MSGTVCSDWNEALYHKILEAHQVWLKACRDIAEVIFPHIPSEAARNMLVVHYGLKGESANGLWVGLEFSVRKAIASANLSHGEVGIGVFRNYFKPSQRARFYRSSTPTTPYGVCCRCSSPHSRRNRALV